MPKFKSTRTLLLALITSLAVAFVIYFLFLGKNTASQRLTLTSDFSLQLPQSWSIIKRPLPNHMDAFIGSYRFVDDYFRENVSHQRIILKNKGTFANLHLTYKSNESCEQTYQRILDSMLVR